MWKPGFVEDAIRKWSMHRFYKTIISKGDVCFDVGANRGERTAILLGLGAKVLAIEPQKACYSELVNRFGRNPDAEILNVAVGNQDGYETLFLCNESDECASFDSTFIQTYSRISGFHWTQSETVKVSTLDSLIVLYGIPDFCKVDVEGFEPEVFSGLTHPISTIHFEFNQPLLNDTISCLEVLEKLGDYGCNYLKYEKMRPILKFQIPISEFVKDIKKLIPSQIETGEILLSLPKN